MSTVVEEMRDNFLFHAFSHLNWRKIAAGATLYLTIHTTAVDSVWKLSGEGGTDVHRSAPLLLQFNCSMAKKLSLFIKIIKMLWQDIIKRKGFTIECIARRRRISLHAAHGVTIGAAPELVPTIDAAYYCL
ncbi:hypothetical protein GOP47_0013380 [Adiantum capillus-veneris]|uniref:Uncharacterized protein n=1 Tax=Adiantum capillus-veneris TaxID=13818 RepID=A0A9D4UNZ0_ADICA|nr:hypothetical protein GOP47_0013380 [Adiantum capillus-veneris]